MRATLFTFIFVIIGSLSLTSLDFVYPSPLMIGIIPKFCPKLKEVVFWKTLLAARIHGRSLEGVGDPKAFQEQLKAWPKVRFIFLIGKVIAGILTIYIF